MEQPQKRANRRVPPRANRAIRLVFSGERAYCWGAMSLAEIEAELDRLGPDELRHLALKSWMSFMKKEQRQDWGNECDETDPQLLAALDEAIAKADAVPGQGHSGFDVRARLNKWTTGYRQQILQGILPGAV